MRGINYLLLIIIFFNFFPLLSNGQVTFEGNIKKIMELTPDMSTGINTIYVADGLKDVSITYTSSIDVKWYKYSNLGGGYAEEIKNIIKDGNKYSLQNPEGNLGYIIESSEKKYIFWLVDYSKLRSEITSIDISPEQECDITWLSINGNSPYIYYYTVNGRQEILSKDYKLSYYNLEWDSENQQFFQVEQTKELANVSEATPVTPVVICPTVFHLSEDRFMRFWGENKNLESNPFTPIGVEAYTNVFQTGSSDGMSNQISGGNDGLGGSAPAVIDFYSYVSDAVIHYEWQIAEDEDFEHILYRINDQDFSFTFDNEGTYYVRFIGSNSDGSCEAFGDIYTVSIGSSELLIPNIFTPDGDGINDEWKVAYRSIIDFDCWIFDRHGHEIIHFSDPSQGWDGKRNGKTVKSGVFYYVIQATGADGRKYKKSGDINVLTPQSRYSSSEED